ncbi:MAG: YkgJ family cysteine cluster protein [Chthoniobacteraceae bacterium]
MSDFPTAQLTNAIGEARSRSEFDAGLCTALEYFDQLNAATIAQTGVHLACRAGCSLCCSLRVDVFAHEVFLIAHHIRTHFSDAEIAGLMERLNIHAAKVLPLTPFEHATQNIVCPLLRDGRCSIYAVRPQSCRRHHSADFAACQFCYDHPTDLDFPGAHDAVVFKTLTEAMQQGIDAYTSLGFDHTIYELGTALAEALLAPERWERWRERERAFVTASVTESAPEG